MTYHLEPWIEKIISPVVLLFPDGMRQEFRNGKEAADKIFSESYKNKEVRAIDNRIEIVLESNPLPDAPSFF